MPCENCNCRKCASNPELAKISKEIKEIKAEMSKSAAQVNLDIDAWEAEGNSAQKYYLRKLEGRVEKLLGMLGYEVLESGVYSYYDNFGWGSKDMPYMVSFLVTDPDDPYGDDPYGTEIDIYPTSDEEWASSISFGAGKFYIEKKFSGSSVDKAFDKFSKWVLATIATELQ
tara:strand:- start:512 stop:1024 length:513 start_codon:yes stop_codon:yes gene_type:complete